MASSSSMSVAQIFEANERAAAALALRAIEAGQESSRRRAARQAAEGDGEGRK